MAQDFPADWYPDPDDNQIERWWDGEAWADYTRPLAPAPEPPKHRPNPWLDSEEDPYTEPETPPLPPQPTYDSSVFDEEEEEEQPEPIVADEEEVDPYDPVSYPSPQPDPYASYPQQPAPEPSYAPVQEEPYTATPPPPAFNPFLPSNSDDSDDLDLFSDEDDQDVTPPVRPSPFMPSTPPQPAPPFAPIPPPATPPRPSPFTPEPPSQFVEDPQPPPFAPRPAPSPFYNDEEPTPAQPQPSPFYPAPAYQEPSAPPSYAPPSYEPPAPPAPPTPRPSPFRPAPPYVDPPQPAPVPSRADPYAPQDSPGWSSSSSYDQPSTFDPSQFSSKHLGPDAPYPSRPTVLGNPHDLSSYPPPQLEEPKPPRVSRRTLMYILGGVIVLLVAAITYSLLHTESLGSWAKHNQTHISDISDGYQRVTTDFNTLNPTDDSSVATTRADCEGLSNSATDAIKSLPPTTTASSQYQSALDGMITASTSCIQSMDAYSEAKTDSANALLQQSKTTFATAEQSFTEFTTLVPSVH